MHDDPERQRLRQLAALSTQGQASDAENEELALYLEEHPELRAALAEEVRQQGLDAGWLERVQADRRLQRREHTRRSRWEQGIGLGLLGAGLLVHPAVMATGAGLLVWSFVRVRLATYRDDPYKDIEQ